jgi:Transposase, Mutator family
MAVTPKSSWPWVRTLLHSVYDQPDAQSIAAQYDRIIDALSDELPKVADHLEDARADLLRSPPSPNRSGARSKIAGHAAGEVVFAPQAIRPTVLTANPKALQSLSCAQISAHPPAQLMSANCRRGHLMLPSP